MILITGFNGFIGNALIGELSKNSEINIRASSRAENKINKKNIDIVSTGEINSDTNWQEALKDCTTVIHTAALTHQMDTSKEEVTLEKYLEINTKGLSFNIEPTSNTSPCIRIETSLLSSTAGSALCFTRGSFCFCVNLFTRE